MKLLNININKPSVDATIIMPLGGLGTRAKKFTKGRYSKFLLPLSRNYTVLDVILRSLLQAGFRRYIFCIGTLFPDQIVEKVLSYKNYFDNLGCIYNFSYESTLLGGVGAACDAIKHIKPMGTLLSVPGDMLLPWYLFPQMIEYHQNKKNSVTIGLTDYITEYTSDVGKIWINNSNSYVVRCLDRNTTIIPTDNSFVPLTSAGVYAYECNILPEIYNTYLHQYPAIRGNQVEMRDHILPWILHEARYSVSGYNFGAEILDVGEYERIIFAKNNWRRFYTE